ncbi:hypothetical protein CYMTET_17899, partial [Cymbomonas tetramitiformis]
VRHPISSAGEVPVAEQGTTAVKAPAAEDVPDAEVPVAQQHMPAVERRRRLLLLGGTYLMQRGYSRSGDENLEQPHFTAGVLLDALRRHRLAEGDYCVGQLQDTISSSALFAEFQRDLAPNTEFKNNFRAFKTKADGQLDTLKDPKMWIGNLVEDTPFYKRFEQVVVDVRDSCVFRVSKSFRFIQELTPLLSSIIMPESSSNHLRSADVTCTFEKPELQVISATHDAVAGNRPKNALDDVRLKDLNGISDKDDLLCCCFCC